MHTFSHAHCISLLIKSGYLRVCSVLGWGGMKWNHSIPRIHSYVRFERGTELGGSTKGYIPSRCGTNPSGRFGRTRWNGTVSPSNLIKFSYN
jgi:hypothetical protein